MPTLAIAATLLCAGCGGRQRKPRTIAIVPVDVLGLPGDYAATMDDALVTEAKKDKRNRLVDPARLGAALPAAAGEASACLEAEPCLIDLGERTGADLVLSLRLAGLGDTHVIRARLIDVDLGMVVKDLQETGSGDRAEVADHTRSLWRRAFPPPSSPRRWWIWAGIAATAVAGATLTVILTGEDTSGIVHVGDL